jgi:AraC-like DNA-binding protein
MATDPGRGGAWEAVVTTILSTDGVARGEREAFWRQALSETFVPMTVGAATGDRFQGRIHADWIGRLLVAEVASTAQDVHRTTREISRTDAEYLQLGMVYRGAARVVQDGREAVLRPGDYTIHETTRPFRWTFGGDWDVGVFTLPRASVGLSEAESRRLTARRLDGQRGITGVVSRFLRDLGRNAGHLSGAQSERVLADLTDLVVTLLGDRADDREVVRSSLQRSLLLRVKDHIDGRLADPTLGPAEIAAAVNISTRYLHQLFAVEHRSVSQYVRGLRLERCRRDLLDPRLADRSIAAIAFGWGFGDLSGFNQAFRAAFGASSQRGGPVPAAIHTPVLIVGGGVTGLSSEFVVLAGVDGSGWMAAAASLMCRWTPTASAWRSPPPTGRPPTASGPGSPAGPAPQLGRLAQQRPLPDPTTQLGGVPGAVLSAPAWLPSRVGCAPDAVKSSLSSKPTGASAPHAGLTSRQGDPRQPEVLHERATSR